ncbi:MAG TPA: 2OG-Fe(II) oxygenase [Acidimicrobiales bacterium]|nr:2OG-Fe(II) oxygenase [Acidimicrobiales bacterium]
MTTALHAPEYLVDLAAYPILDLDGDRARAVISTARDSLRRTGAAELPGFVTREALYALKADAESLEHLAHRSGGTGTAYLAAPDGDLPAGHPRRYTGRYAVGAVAYDLFPTWSPLRRMYECAALLAFIEAVLDRGPLFRYADPCGALNLAVMGDGDELQWHYDMTDFVVSLAIRDAERGGDFEVAPMIRSAEDERYDDVARVLSGDRSQVVTLPMTPGTLLLFEGRNSLHRVTPVVGSVTRLVGLLAYDTKPGTVSSARLRMDRYGRDS